jgi:hypothetical protein
LIVPGTQQSEVKGSLRNEDRQQKKNRNRQQDDVLLSFGSIWQPSWNDLRHVISGQGVASQSDRQTNGQKVIIDADTARLRDFDLQMHR